MHRNRLHPISALFAVTAMLGASSLFGQSRPVPDGLRRAEPVSCSGNDSVVLRGRFIDTSGVAVTVQGNCVVEIAGSHIVAGGTGVLVQGNGQARLADSYVEGGRASLVAQGYGQIRYRETTLRGATRIGGRARIDGDDGAAHAAGSASAAGGAAGLGDLLGTVSIGAGGVRIQDGDETISIGAGGVVVDDGHDTVAVRPTAEGVRVETPGAAVTVDADVSIEGDMLRLSAGGSIEISDGWRTGQSTYLASDTDRLLIELGARDDGGELHIGLAGDVLFDLDSTAIQAAGAAELRKLAHVLRQRAGGEIRLVGHTDSLGSDDYNLKLSQARAVSVMRWLNREEGIPARLMVGQGMGSKQPIAYNTLPDGSDNPEGRARNRRVEVFLNTRR